jgi:hypothetical protein
MITLTDCLPQSPEFLRVFACGWQAGKEIPLPHIPRPSSPCRTLFHTKLSVPQRRSCCCHCCTAAPQLHNRLRQPITSNTTTHQ